jgi:uncharacterized protein YndB with AHSA1/START domain
MSEWSGWSPAAVRTIYLTETHFSEKDGGNRGRTGAANVKWILIVAGVVVFVALAAVAIGASLPKEHTATRSARFRESPDVIWSTLTGFAQYPAWRSTVKSVEILPPVNGMAAWREADSHGNAIPYVLVESDAPRRMTTRITDPKLPFGGTWTFEITPDAGGGSSVRITEHGEVYNPLFRFVSRYIMGYTATIDAYLKALGAKFGETPVLEN